MSTSFCFDCRFFVPEGTWLNDLTEGQWDECIEGECRAALPVLGQLLTDRHGDPFRDFGDWPKVLASDWCGQFEPREKPGATRDTVA
jgi:hypothetical protein